MDVASRNKSLRVGVLGLSYKANVDDVRESPAFKVIKHLKEHGAKVETFDPHVKKRSSMKTLEALLKKSDALVLVTDHREFKEIITPALLKKHGIKVIIDGKNCLNKASFAKSGIIYKGIGR